MSLPIYVYVCTFYLFILYYRAEYHAYRNTVSGTVGTGWTDTVYTLTAQHLQCKHIPELVSTTKPIFAQLIRAIYSLYPGRIKLDSITYESEGEPHLVKYNGKAKGTQLHTDNSKFLSITVNILLSDPRVRQYEKYDNTIFFFCTVIICQSTLTLFLHLC